MAVEVFVQKRTQKLSTLLHVCEEIILSNNALDLERGSATHGMPLICMAM
jgi:hypothetical protein